MTSKPKKTYGPVQGLSFVVIFIRILKILNKKLRNEFFATWLLMAIYSFLEMALVGLISIFVATIIQPDYITSSGYGKIAISTLSRFVNINNSNLLFYISAFIVVVITLKMAIRATTDYRVARYSAEVDAYVGSIGMKRILQMHYQNIKSYKMADLLIYVDWRTYFGSDFVRSFLMITQSATLFCIITATLFVAYPALTSFIFFGVGSIATVIFVLLKNSIDKSVQTYRDCTVEVSRRTVKCFSSIREIKLAGCEYSIHKENHKGFYDIVRSRSRQIFAMRLPSNILEAVGLILLVGIVLTMVSMGEKSSAVTSIAAVFALASTRILSATSNILSEVTTLRCTIPFISHMLDLMDAPIAPKDIDPICKTIEKTMPLNQSLNLKNLSFTYENSDNEALSELSLNIKQGELVGVIGSSGAGKSTLIDVLTGLFSPSSGTMEIDGKTIDSTNKRSWMRSIGYVPQAPYLFEGSVAENIAFGIAKNDIDKKRVAQCCEMASIDFLDQQGVEMHLNEGGKSLSGGQSQRLSIARALYHMPQVLLLDEPTSALDEKNKTQIKRLLSNLKKKHTIIIISHQLETINICDRIIWLESGKVVMDDIPELVIDTYRAHSLKQDSKGQNDNSGT